MDEELLVERTHKPGCYECLWCDCCFVYQSGELLCRNCGSCNQADLVLIHTEEDTSLSQMLTADDFHGG